MKHPTILSSALASMARRFVRYEHAIHTALLSLVLFTVTSPASAAVANFMRLVGAGRTIMGGVLVLFGFVGLIIMGLGFKDAVDKQNDQRSDITTGRIMGKILGGAAMGLVGVVFGWVTLTVGGGGATGQGGLGNTGL